MGSEWARSQFHRENARRCGVALAEFARALDDEGQTAWAAETRAHRERVETGDPHAINALIALVHARRVADAASAARTEALADAIHTMVESTLAQRTFRERVSLLTWRDWRNGIAILVAFLFIGMWPLWGALIGWLQSR